jgi:hypothetical protein
MYRTLLALTFLFFFAPSGTAIAQEHEAAMNRLAAFAGTYSLDGDYHDPAGQVHRSAFDGDLTISSVLGGEFQEWDWTMDMGDEGVTHLRMIATYDPTTDGYSVWRFDTRDLATGRALGAKGDLRFEGDALVMVWRMANPDDPTEWGAFRNVVRRTASGLHVDTSVVPDGRARMAVATTRASRG